MKTLISIIILIWSLPIYATVVKIPLPQKSFSSSTSERNNYADEYIEDYLSFHPASEHVDLVVVFTDENGRDILPDASRRNMTFAQAAVTNELTFTYNSFDYPFTQEELNLLQTAIPIFKNAIKEIYGPPAFNLVINVRKNPNISSAGIYYSYYNEIVVPFVNKNNLDVICHEIVHAFHDDYTIDMDSWEEGFARSVEVLVLSRVDEYEHSWDSNFSYSYDVWYEGENNSGVGGEDGSFYNGNIAITLLRYQMAGYAWAKVFYENNNFYKDFNLAYYNKMKDDWTIKYNEEELKEIVKSAVPSVEMVQFDDWYKNQYILNTEQLRGYQITSRVGQYTFDYFYRDEYGYDESLAEELVSVDFYDSNNSFINSLSGETTLRGWVDLNPQEDYVGRLKMIAYTDEIENIFYRVEPGLHGVFGIVKNSKSGHISISSPIASMPTVAYIVKDGAFNMPNLKDIEGRFIASFTSDDGIVVSRGFNKGASDYFLLIDDEVEEPPVVVEPEEPVEPPIVVEPVEPPVEPPLIIEPEEPVVVEPEEPVIEEPIIQREKPEEPIVTEPIDGNPITPVKSSSGGGGGCFIMSTFN